jgi:hypothetical protein
MLSGKHPCLSVPQDIVRGLGFLFHELPEAKVRDPVKGRPHPVPRHSFNAKLSVEVKVRDTAIYWVAKERDDAWPLRKQANHFITNVPRYKSRTLQERGAFSLRRAGPHPMNGIRREAMSQKVTQSAPRRFRDVKKENRPKRRGWLGLRQLHGHGLRRTGG